MLVMRLWEKNVNFSLAIFDIKTGVIKIYMDMNKNGELGQVILCSLKKIKSITTFL